MLMLYRNWKKFNIFNSKTKLIIYHMINNKLIQSLIINYLIKIQNNFFKKKYTLTNLKINFNKLSLKKVNRKEQIITKFFLIFMIKIYYSKIYKKFINLMQKKLKI